MLCATHSADAERITYSLQDPMGLNAVSVAIDSHYSPIRGFCDRIDGRFQFDKETGHIDGTMNLWTENLRFAGHEMNAKLHSEDWFFFDRHRQIKLTIKGVEDVEELDDGLWRMKARGAMMMRGRAGGFDFPITIRFIEDGMTTRTNGNVEGDAVFVQGRCSFSRSDFNVNPNPDLFDWIGDEVEFEFNVVAWAP